MLGDLRRLHILGHCRVHQPRSVHVHPQPVAVSKPTDLGGGRGGAGSGGTPGGTEPRGVAGTNVSCAPSSSARPWCPCGAVLPGPAARAEAGLLPATGSYLLEVGEGQRPAPRRAVRVLQADELGARVVPAAVGLADGQLQLVQVEGAVRQVRQRLGVDASDLRPGQGREQR